MSKSAAAGSARAVSVLCVVFLGTLLSPIQGKEGVVVGG
jgi:hypothetical protein